MTVRIAREDGPYAAAPPSGGICPLLGCFDMWHVKSMAPIIEAFRYAYLGAGRLEAGGLLYSAGFMLVIIFLGSIIFNRVEQTFMDTV